MKGIVKVKEIMSTNLQIFSPEATVKEATLRMAEVNVGILIITVPNTYNIVGVFSERDVVKKIVNQGLNPETTLVHEVMTSKVVAIDQNTDVIDAWKLMKEKHIRHLPITDASKNLIGVISARDVLDYLANTGQLIALLNRR